MCPLSGHIYSMPPVPGPGSLSVAEEAARLCSSGRYAVGTWKESSASAGMPSVPSWSSTRGRGFSYIACTTTRVATPSRCAASAGRSTSRSVSARPLRRGPTYLEHSDDGRELPTTPQPREKLTQAGSGGTYAVRVSAGGNQSPFATTCLGRYRRMVSENVSSAGDGSQFATGMSGFGSVAMRIRRAPSLPRSSGE